MPDTWLKILKAGDKVIAANHYGNRIETVARVTPSGRTRTEYNYYDANGRELGYDGWYPSHLEEATLKALQQIQDKNTIEKTLALMQTTRKITIEQAKKILEILEDKDNA
jgi:hypothetical protein